MDELDKQQDIENKRFDEEYAKTQYTTKPEKVFPAWRMMRMTKKLTMVKA